MACNDATPEGCELDKAFRAHLAGLVLQYERMRAARLEEADEKELLRSQLDGLRSGTLGFPTNSCATLNFSSLRDDAPIPNERGLTHKDVSTGPGVSPSNGFSAKVGDAQGRIQSPTRGRVGECIALPQKPEDKPGASPKEEEENSARFSSSGNIYPPRQEEDGLRIYLSEFSAAEPEEDAKNDGAKDDRVLSLPPHLRNTQVCAGWHDASQVAMEHLEVWPIWHENSGRSALDVKNTADSSPAHRARASSMRSGDMLRSASCLQKFVLTPAGAPRTTWDLMSALILFWDIVMIPLQVFNFDPTEFTITGDLLTTCFWSVDLPLSFLVGFQTGATLEMRPMYIAKRYMKGMFAMDTSIVLVDWFIILTEQAAADSIGVLRIGKGFRVMRVVRLLRLLRTAKVFRSLVLHYDDLSELIHSETASTLLAILQLIAAIAVVNHFIACMWFAIGNVHSLGTPSWVTKLDLDTDEAGGTVSVQWQYTTAFHWSLTQFTPASMEIVPQNTQERVYTIIVLLFAMVVFSSFVSSITNAMTKLRVMNRERAMEKETVKRYFIDNKVSLDLMNRITGFLRHNHYHDSRKRVHEEEVLVLKLLPETLRLELHRGVFAPVLICHPFFLNFADIDDTGFGDICHSALSEEHVVVKQEVFNYGDTGRKMWFIRSGSIGYYLGQSCVDDVVLHADEWLCEVVLWLKWFHRGRAVVVTTCELMALDAACFRDISKRRRPAFSQTRDYAWAYYEEMVRVAEENFAKFSDICFNVRCSEQELCDKAFVNSVRKSWSMHNHTSIGRSMTTMRARGSLIKATPSGSIARVLRSGSIAGVLRR